MLKVSLKATIKDICPVIISCINKIDLTIISTQNNINKLLGLGIGSFNNLLIIVPTPLNYVKYF